MINNTIVVVNLSSKCFLVYSSGTIQEMKSGDVHCSHALQRKKTSVQDKTEQRLGAQEEVMPGNTNDCGETLTSVCRSSKCSTIFGT